MVLSQSTTKHQPQTQQAQENAAVKNHDEKLWILGPSGFQDAGYGV
jgi:hypothetical protein